jgi:hypothetical protein
MPARHIARRASAYRYPAQQLAREADRVRDDCDHKHLLDLAEMYQCAAGQMAPATSLALEAVKITSGS